jgi:hypothetical protein
MQKFKPLKIHIHEANESKPRAPLQSSTFLANIQYGSNSDKENCL